MSKPADIDPVLAIQLGRAHPYVPGQPGRPSLARLAREKREAEAREADDEADPFNIHDPRHVAAEARERWLRGEDV